MTIQDLRYNETYKHLSIGRAFKFKGNVMKKGKYLFVPTPTPNPVIPWAPENGGILLTEEEIKKEITNTQ